MPTFTVTDPETGQSLDLEGDSPPTEQELTEVFGQFRPAQPKIPVATEAQLRQQMGLGDFPVARTSEELGAQNFARRNGWQDGLRYDEPAYIGGTKIQTAPGEFIPTVRTPEEAGLAEKIAAGIYNTAAGAGNFALSPSGLVTALAPEVLPAGILGPALKGVFGGLMAKGAGQALGTASVTHDPQDITEGALAAAGALGIPLWPEGTPPPPQGPMATGEVMQMPQGAPRPRFEPPPDIETATPEQAAAQRNLMQRTATTTFEPPPPPRATVPEGPEEPPAPPAAAPAPPAAPELESFDEHVEDLKRRGKPDMTVRQVQALYPDLFPNGANREGARALLREAFPLSPEAQAMMAVQEQGGGIEGEATSGTLSPEAEAALRETLGTPPARRAAPAERTAAQVAADAAAPNPEYSPEDWAKYQQLQAQLSVKITPENMAEQFAKKGAIQKEWEALKNKYGGKSPAQLSKPAPAAPAETQEPAPTGTAFDPSKVPTVEHPVADIVVNKDVPQFKEGADPATGTVPEDRLEGKYQRTPGMAPVVLWQKLNGETEIITGRNRLDLARRTGEKTIPAQIVREADGFTKDMALTTDAEANIRDGQGTLEDYAHYFKNSPDLTEDAERSRNSSCASRSAEGCYRFNCRE